MINGSTGYCAHCNKPIEDCRCPDNRAWHWYTPKELQEMREAANAVKVEPPKDYHKLNNLF